MKKQNGFTLIELLIAMAIFGVVMAAVYVSYVSQQTSYINQEQVATMQQNMRAIVNMIEKDMHMVGYALPRATYTGNRPGFIANPNPPNRTSFTITMDMDQNGEIVASGTTTVDPSGPEIVTYQFNAANMQLQRRENGGDLQIIADNIEAVDFVYLDAGNVMLNPLGGPILTPVQLASISSVQITMITRSTQADPKYLNNRVYQNQWNQTILAVNDNFRRRIMTAEVHCRNLLIN